MKSKDPQFKVKTETADDKAIPNSNNRYKQVEFLQEKNPIIYDTHKQFWVWNKTNKFYEISDETTILKLFRNIIHDEDTHKSQVKSEIIESVRQTGRVPIDVPTPNYIQFKNCVIDINTGEKFIATPEYFWTNPIPHNLGLCGDTPTIDKLFNDWVGKENSIDLYEILAYTLYRNYPIHKIFTLYGIGRNGKGQFVRVLEKLISLYNIFSTDTKNLIGSRFESAGLRNKLVVLISETDGVKLRGTSKIKAMSGNDLLRYEIKGSSDRDDEFRSYAKMIVLTNNIPNSDDDSDGFYDRWFIENFPNQFKTTGIDIINTIPNYEYENLCHKLVKILKGLLDRGKFTHQKSIRGNKEEYNRLSNPIKEFIINKFVISSELNISTKDFKNKFDNWCVMNKVSIIGIKEINKQIREMGYEIKQTTINNIKTQYIYGLDYDYNHITLRVTDQEDPRDISEQNEY